MTNLPVPLIAGTSAGIVNGNCDINANFDQLVKCTPTVIWRCLISVALSGLSHVRDSYFITQQKP